MTDELVAVFWGSGVYHKIVPVVRDRVDYSRVRCGKEVTFAYRRWRGRRLSQVVATHRPCRRCYPERGKK